MEVSLTYSFFLIFGGAAVLASIALAGRQPIIMAYIILGALMGPYGLEMVTDIQLLDEIAEIGILFLLFLLGLDMQPKALRAVLRQATWVALISSVVFFAGGYICAILFGFSGVESLIIGLACMFSSTIISIKLLPTTVLHHRHAGELMIGLLLLQDLIAILILLCLMPREPGSLMSSLMVSVVSLPLIAIAAALGVKYILSPLIHRFDRFHEYIFLIAIGWCLSIAELGVAAGLSAEIGAFIAGIALATSPIAQYIAVNLKPLRDFFLVLFFFAIGAKFDSSLLSQIIWPSITIALLMLALKPITYRFLLRRFSESNSLAWDIGFRLGQISEFSLLIGFLAAKQGLIGQLAAQTIQATAIITFMISSYIVILNLKTPIASSDSLRRD